MEFTPGKQFFEDSDDLLVFLVKRMNCELSDNHYWVKFSNKRTTIERGENRKDDDTVRIALVDEDICPTPRANSDECEFLANFITFNEEEYKRIFYNH